MTKKFLIGLDKIVASTTEDLIRRADENRGKHLTIGEKEILQSYKGTAYVHKVETSKEVDNKIQEA